MDDSVAASSSATDACESNENEEIHWRFSQIKGNIESEESSTDGLMRIKNSIIYFI